MVRLLNLLRRAIHALFRLGRKPRPHEPDDDEPTIYPMW